MALRGSIDVSELRRLAADAGATAEELDLAIRSSLAVSTAVALRTSRMAAPIFTGEGVNSIRTQGLRITPSATSIVYQDRVFTTAISMVVMEGGRRPGAQLPPDPPIRRWVTLKASRGDFDLTRTGKKTKREQIDAATWAVQTTIRRKGISARRFMAAAENAGEDRLEAELRDAADVFRRRIG